jgi:riboflavin kinase, archaea type
MGNFSYWIEKLHQHYFRKTGMKLFPGTLNVQLDEPFELPKQIIRLEGEEYGGSVSVNIVPCSTRLHICVVARSDLPFDSVLHQDDRTLPWVQTADSISRQ